MLHSSWYMTLTKNLFSYFLSVVVFSGTQFFEILQYLVYWNKMIIKQKSCKQMIWYSLDILWKATPFKKWLSSALKYRHKTCKVVSEYWTHLASADSHGGNVFVKTVFVSTSVMQNTNNPAHEIHITEKQFEHFRHTNRHSRKTNWKTISFQK